MQKQHKHKSAEAAERERKHQFGQPDANRRGNPSTAANQREFYRWCESVATQEELKAYAKDESKPFARRKFVMSLTGCESIQDFFDLTNQTHGAPKQTIETTALPSIQIVLE